MTLLTPPGYAQGGTYSARLDRVYNTTTRVIADASAALAARQGFYTGRRATYSNPSGWNINLNACAGVVANTFAASAGDYEFANDGTVGVVLAASSPTLNRQDIVGYQVKDNFYDASGLTSIIPAVIQGASVAGSPADPALPASFIPVVRAVVSAGSTAPVLQSLVRYTTNDGGVLRIDSLAQRAELTAYPGLTIWRTDRTHWTETHDGTAWRVNGIAICTTTADRNTNVASPLTGDMAWTTADTTLWVWRGSAWERYPRGIISRGRRATTSAVSGSTTPVGVMRLDGLTLRAGQLYVIRVPKMHPTSSSTGDVIRVEIRFNTAGNASTASPVLPDAQVYEAFGNSSSMEAYYVPGADVTVSFLLCVARETGAGNASLYADGTRATLMEVRAEGTDTGNAAVLL